MDRFKQRPQQQPGIMPELDLIKFGSTQIEIVHNLATVWFVTRAEIARYGNDTFYTVFLKPTDELLNRFHLFGNVLCILHPYSTLDGRVFELIEKQLSNNQYRLDKLCVLLISNATVIESTVKRISAESEARIFVPFRYQEWRGGAGGKRDLTIQRLQEQLFTKNLFGMSSALKTDRYFFGRKADIQRIIGKYQAGENASIFGLRRIGKTSVLWAVVRELINNNTPVAFIDCSDSRYHKQSWNIALFQIKQSLFEANQLAEKGHSVNKYTEQNASVAFQQDLELVKQKFGKPVLFIFDEIENLCFDLSPTDKWSSGEYYLIFWQTLRSIFQQNPNLFSFLLCGVNPKSIETAVLRDGRDNPLYRYIEADYLGFFDVDDVTQMVEMIGGYMGMQFDKEIYTYLTDEYGGHPFLIRQVCSQLYKNNSSETIPRKIHIRKEAYKKEKNKLADTLADYVDLILHILVHRYPDEYTLLKHLAANDYTTFNNFVEEDRCWIQHLVGYGLISKVGEKYHFRISVVEESVKRVSKHLQTPETVEERWSLLSECRNSFESELRKLVRSNLKIALGNSLAQGQIINAMHKPQQKERAKSLKYDEIFANEIYFSDLRRAVVSNWSIFQNIFENDKDRFVNSMIEVNSFRADAHAKNITIEEFSKAMSGLSWLSRCIAENS